MTTKARREAAALYEHRSDKGEWGDDVEEIKVRPKHTEVVSFRLSSDELDRLEDAAAAAAESLSQFVRRAIQMRIEGSGLENQQTPVVDVMTGRATLVLNLSGTRISSMGEAPTSWVPDHPPVLATVVPGDG